MLVCADGAAQGGWEGKEVTLIKEMGTDHIWLCNQFKYLGFYLET